MPCTHKQTCEECEEEWPQIGDAYWWINYDGSSLDALWQDSMADHEALDFLGVYKTEEEALKARDAIRQFVQDNLK